ncbi:hypothetical protein ACFLQL_00280 [Verrucomicrobiota bacterium]
MLWVAIHGLANGEQLEESILNRPLYELKERTDYLYQQITAYAGVSPFETVLIPDLAVDPESELQLGDIVYLDPTTRKLTKAAATTDLFNNIFLQADIASIALGIVTYLNPVDSPTIGTVAMLGKVTLSDAVSGSWLTTRMLETGEAFRSGPYYLSSVEPGKITANPAGPAIYIGYFLNQVADPTLLDYAIISTQYKDVASAHNHRAIAMATQPAGTQTYVADPITGTHTVYGFDPTADIETFDGLATVDADDILTAAETFIEDNLIGLTLYNVTKATSATITDNDAHTITAAGIDWDVDDEYKVGKRCRIVIKGSWLSTEDVQYTLTLAGASIAAPPSGGVTGFDSVYMHCVSSDPNEETTISRIRSYESLVAIGTKGLTVCLENIIATAWNTVEESATGSGSLGTSRREWILDIPEQIKGWQAVRERKYFSDHFSGTDQKYSFIVLGGPQSSDDNRLLDTVTVKALHLYRIIYGTTVPTDGDTVTVSIDAVAANDRIYEFDDNESVTSPNIKVAIVAGDADLSFRNLVDAILAEEITGVDTAISIVNHHLLIGTTNIGDVATTYTLGVTEILAAGPWDIGATNGLMVYDKDHVALVPTTSYWSNADFYTPLLLSNNLYIMVIPYDSDGTDPVGTEIVNSDYWDCDILDEAPGAYFIYNIYTHQEFSQTYPPIPFVSGALVLNGIELDSYALFTTSYSYRFGTTGVYWMTNKYGYVPWPADWVSVTNPGSAGNIQNMVYHNIRMATGDSGIVSSLQPAPNSPIRVLKCGTSEDGTVGNLMLDLDLQLTELSSNIEGYQVYKGISSNKLLKGPVVSEIVAGPGVTISSPPGVDNGRGKVTVGLSSGAGLSGLFENVSLENAKQEKIGMFPYVRLLGWVTGGTNINTGFTCNFKLPHTISGNYRVLVYLTMFGETVVSNVEGVDPSTLIKYAGLEFSYSVLHDYLTPAGDNSIDNLVDGIITPASAVSIDVPIGLAATYPANIYNAYDPIIIHNNENEPVKENMRIMWLLGNPFPKVEYDGGGTQIGDLQGGSPVDPAYAYVTAGSLVSIRVRRAASSATPAYTSNLGFINMMWQLV